MTSIQICGELFDLDSRHFVLPFRFERRVEPKELEKLHALSALTSASLGSTLLDDEGLMVLPTHAPGIRNLDLQDTRISNEGLRYLSGLRNLEHLRLKDNPQLDQSCLPHLNALTSLTDLQIHETGIGQEGYRLLRLPGLRNLLLNDGDHEVLLALSQQLPQCHILIKGRRSYYNGRLDWER